ncbi:hypothetical protein [Photobacterium phosphoreum]|jgi:hypothetical protein|uniref:hypothetical protein n=1 Tax=Photobacterium phosphoreum TaxID=659 RepID=UPI001E3A38B5|nr:hypothetical protein [Photobacterium phosphoreum]MCD9509519.1 hypothetical protein [Photobacterium phosphoreum]
MQYINQSCYHLFIDKGSFIKFEGNADSEKNFQEFAKIAVTHTEKNENKQEYLFNEKSLVHSIFTNYINQVSTWDLLCRDLSKKLLATQKESQRSIDHWDRKVIPGSLLIIHCKQNNSQNDILVLVKMEQEEFAKVNDFEHEYGLPTEKKALNTAFIIFEKNKSPSMLVSRANAFWINFLDVSPVRSDTVNTANIFKSIDSLLNRKVKNEGFKSDYVSLRNHLLTYLRNNEGQPVQYTDLVATVFNAHKPLDVNFKSNEFVTELEKLPNKKKTSKLSFDTNFQVDLTDVKANKINTKISLTDKIELNIKDGIENLTDTIKPHESDGRKGIIIYTDEGFDWFKRGI